ncbi:unnamed protein product [Acanthoscelides obtectus]|uniref:PiggyBac transposable element-derived protein domain-containing protein n=1 Tax=Acanthoscelides obtectus TaxID=200917 RepID=A0A9P0JM23_ACAOB|nr:unnamed protein product [Acanthoscelides obtectus]CAK1641340.1 PiggyBac transposable element-derived protein 4 [Acanthoscelides obtectus]
MARHATEDFPLLPTQSAPTHLSQINTHLLIDTSHTTTSHIQTYTTAAPSGSASTVAQQLQPRRISPVELREPEKWRNVNYQFIILAIKMNCAVAIDGGIRIVPKTKDDYRKIIWHFKEQNIAYHTFPLQSKRNIHAVLRSIPASLNEKEMKQVLDQKGYTPLHLIRLKRSGGTPMPLVVVILPKSHELFNEKELLGLSIKVTLQMKRFLTILSMTQHSFHQAVVKVLEMTVKNLVFDIPTTSFQRPSKRSRLEKESTEDESEEELQYESNNAEVQNFEDSTSASDADRPEIEDNLARDSQEEPDSGIVINLHDLSLSVWGVPVGNHSEFVGTYEAGVKPELYAALKGLWPVEYYLAFVDVYILDLMGRLLFKQYNPQKGNKYGIKVFKLCTQNGCTWNLSVYAGKVKEGQLAVSTSIVLKLARNLLGSGRICVIDNWYTSLQLAHILLDNKTHCLGTLRNNLKGNPDKVLKKKLKKAKLLPKKMP